MRSAPAMYLLTMVVLSALAACGESDPAAVEPPPRATSTPTPSPKVTVEPTANPTGQGTTPAPVTPSATSLSPGTVSLAIKTGEGWTYRVDVPLTVPPDFIIDVSTAPPGMADWNVQYPEAPVEVTATSTDVGRTAPTLLVTNKSWSWSHALPGLANVQTPPEFCGFTSDQLICTYVGVGDSAPARLTENAAKRAALAGNDNKPTYRIAWFDPAGSLQRCGVEYQGGKIIKEGLGESNTNYLFADIDLCGTASIVK